MDRRNFLKTCIGSSILSQTTLNSLAKTSALPNKAKNLVCIGVPFGYLAEEFRPTSFGRNYASSQYLDMLQKHKNDFTVFQGVSHPNCNGGHGIGRFTFTGADHTKSNTISIDQLLANYVGHRTQLPYLNITLNRSINMSRGLAYNAQGVGLPAYSSHAQIHRLLFKPFSKEEILQKKTAIRMKRDYLKEILKQQVQFRKTMGKADKQTLESYLSSFHTLEKRLRDQETWVSKPKPNCPSHYEMAALKEGMFVQRAREHFKLMHIALESGATRIINYQFHTVGYGNDTHYLTHSTGNASLRAELIKREQYHFELLDEFLTSLKTTKRGNKSLLDETIVVLVGGMSSSSSHQSNNLPVIVAGGGLNHQGALQLNRGKSKKYSDDFPLNNIYLSILHQLGLSQVHSFGKDGNAPFKDLLPS